MLDDLAEFYLYFFFNDTATTEIYTLSLHDALPISSAPPCSRVRQRAVRLVSLPMRPELNRGWCQYATVHIPAWFARSLRNHTCCMDAGPKGIFEFKTITCHAPRRKL